VPSELKMGGDLAIMYRPPRGQLRKYTKNQTLDVSHMNTETVMFKVDKAWYWNLKLDYVDEKQIPEIGKWIKEFQDDSLEQLASEIDHDVMVDMVHGAHACNKGAAAGARTHTFNLGKIGAPLELTAAGSINVLTLMAQLDAVLSEQNAPAKGRFVVWPTIAKPLFQANTILANACASGLPRSLLLGGALPEVMGASHYFSANIPTFKDPLTGEVTYPIIMGLKSATGYVNQLTKTEVISQDSRHFGKYWRGLQLAGWGVLRPEYLAVAYVKVAPIF